MSWASKFFLSSIGQKAVMGITGLFLVVFLIVHLIGNLQLLVDDGGRLFNVYAEFMTTNPIIKTISYTLYASILIHAVQGILLAIKNRRARGGLKYAVKTTATTNIAARNMAIIGTIVFIFILIHMYQFWLQTKLDALEYVKYDDYDVAVKNLYEPVTYVFSLWYFVAFYIFSMILLAFHLYQGFQSAFQTFGLNHKKYTPLIKVIGTVYAVLVPLGFAIIPLFFYLTRA